MSDDIRVYWDEVTEDYCMIMIDTGDFYWGYNMYDSPYTGSGFDVQLWLPFDLGESIPASYSLVYDSTEDTAWIKMIDDNLVVPDIGDICISSDSGLRIKDGAFRMQERNPWCTSDTYNLAVAHSNQKAYHEERTA